MIPPRLSNLFLMLSIGFSPLCLSEEEDLFTLSLEELMMVEVSGAAFSDDSILAAPASVTVFSSNDIRRLGVKWVHELANYVPGFQSKRQSDNAHVYSLSSRGRQIGTGTRSVKIVINGLAVTSGYIASSSATIYGIPTDNISKVEFIRGPGSAVHGSGALLGIINIETYNDNSSVGISAGNHQYHGGFFNLVERGYYLSVNFSGDRGHDYSLLDPDSRERVQSRDPKQDQHIYFGKNTGLTQFSFHHHHSSESGYYGFDRVDNLSNRALRSYSSLNVDHILQSTSYFDLKGRFFANNRYAEFTGRLSPPGVFSAISNPSSEEPLIATTKADSSQYGLRVLAEWLLLSGHISVGGEYVYSDKVDAVALGNFNIIDISQVAITGNPIEYFGNNPEPIPFIEPKDNQTLSIFSELQYFINEDLNSITSLRYDYAESIDEGKLLPRLALVYRLAENSYLKVIHSQAFRNPGSIELYATNNNTLLGNEDLSSEVVRSNELIWSYQNKRLYNNLSLFDNQIDKSIEQAVEDGRRIFVNLDKETNYGVEWEFKVQLDRNIQIEGTYHHLFDMFDSAVRLSEKTGSINFSLINSDSQVSIGSIYHSDSKMFSDSSGSLKTLPSYWVHNFKYSYFSDEKLIYSLHISNLEDRNFQTPTISTNLDEGLPGRGRQIIFSIESKI